MSDHPRSGQDTFFVEKYLNSMCVNYWHTDYLELLKQLNPELKDIIKGFWSSLAPFDDSEKLHTCRKGYHFKAGDMLSIRVWCGKPYYSKQIKLLPDIAIIKTYHFSIKKSQFYIDNKFISADKVKLIANNDGLSVEDFCDWFKYPKAFDGQIIVWSNKVKY